MAQDGRKEDRALVKFCGLQTHEEVESAFTLGADAIGFIFVKSSPRYIDPVTAQKIFEEISDEADYDPWRIGVFQNSPLDELFKTMIDIDLLYVQLHGDESTSYCEEIHARDPLLGIIKTLAVSKPIDMAEIDHWLNFADIVLLDGVAAGSGREIPEEYLTPLINSPLRKSVILSGGLTPENVHRKLSLYDPLGVDVSSGIESAPGKKCAQLMGRFMQSVTHASNQKRT